MLLLLLLQKQRITLQKKRTRGGRAKNGEQVENKNLNRFQFLVFNNIFSSRWERALLKAQKKTF